MAITMLLVTLAIRSLLTIHELSVDVTESHLQQREIEYFFNACETAFDGLSNRSAVTFEYQELNNRYDTYLVLTEAPDAFRIGIDQRKRVDHVLLAAEHRKDGWLRVSLYYLDQIEFGQVKKFGFGAVKTYPGITLINKAQQLSWRFFNPNTKTWQNTIVGYRPTLVELSLRRPEDIQATTQTYALK